jgi:hypothetical protein
MFGQVNEAMVERWTEKWVAREITNFQYCCILNLLSGRVFNWEVTLSPIFPSLSVNFEECDDYTIRLGSGEKAEGSQGLFSLPEIYYLPQACQSFDVVYKNRQRLENIENFDVWVSKAFGTPHSNFLHMQLFHKPHPKRRKLEPPESTLAQTFMNDSGQQKIIFFWAMKSVCGCVYDDGTVTFGLIAIDSNSAKYEHLLTSSIEPGSPVFGLADGLAVYNERLAILTLDGTFVKTDPLFLKMFVLSETVCQVSETRFMKLHFDGRSIHLVEFADVPARVLCFASAKKFNRTVAGCDDGKLRIRSNQTGKKVATIDLAGELPLRVLITKRWGLIVVKTVDSLLVFDLNGFPVAKVPQPGDIRWWISFRTRDGFDFVAYQTDDFKCAYFEAARPEKVGQLENGGSGLIGILYHWRSDYFLYIIETGKVFVMSRPKLPT